MRISQLRHPLFELFNQTLPFEVEEESGPGGGGFKYTFTTPNGIKYFAEAAPLGDDNWNFQFHQNINPDAERNPFDSGSKFIIFSTLVKILRDFIQRENPGSIAFFGYDEKRRRVYASLAKMFEKQFAQAGYRVANDELGVMLFRVER